MTKVILIIWIGVFDNQIMSTEKFDTMTECENFRKELIIFHNDFNSDYVKCIEYKTE